MVIALVVRRKVSAGYEVLAGNTSDRTTLRGSLDKIEAQYGRARRAWIMDRGIPGRGAGRDTRFTAGSLLLVGTPRGKIQQYAKRCLELPWQKVRRR